MVAPVVVFVKQIFAGVPVTVVTELNEASGEAHTWTILVLEVEPEQPAEVVRVSDALYVPGVLKQMFEGFCCDEVEGVPPVKVQVYVDAVEPQLVKFTHKGTQPAVSFTAIHAVGN
jgi:hypothetical protein